MINTDNSINTIESLSRDDRVECECDEYDVCDVCRDDKWKEGLCYGCLDECNPASQTCGRCARNGW